VSDATGKLKIDRIAEGDLKISMLDSNVDF